MRGSSSSLRTFVIVRLYCFRVGLIVLVVGLYCFRVGFIVLFVNNIVCNGMGNRLLFVNESRARGIACGLACGCHCVLRQ